ncbi:MAG: lipopolysaccharide heptosyltransferase II [Thermodesulfobacteriota bacterium]
MDRTVSHPERIVIRGTNWVGDTIISLPALKQIRRIFPSSIITLWVRTSLKGLVEATQTADRVISFDQNSAGPVLRSVHMMRRLADERFDAAILLQNAFESAFTAWLARIPLRVGYPTDLRGPLLNVRVPLTANIRAMHQVFYYLAIADYVAERFARDKMEQHPDPDCSIPVPPEKCRSAEELLAEHGLEPSKPFFVLCPGSVNSEAKRWPPSHFAALGDLMAERLKAPVVFLGALDERDLIESIGSMMKAARLVNLAGTADMLTSMAIMNLSNAVISNDTGSAHLAVAASARVFTIFGATSPGATAPYGPNAHVLQGNASCAPCRHFRCPYPDHPCMTSLTPEAVFERIMETV